MVNVWVKEKHEKISCINIIDYLNKNTNSIVGYVAYVEAKCIQMTQEPKGGNGGVLRFLYYR